MRRHHKMRAHNNQDQGMSDDSDSEPYYENTISSSKHKRVGKSRVIEDKKTTKNVTKKRKAAPWTEIVDQEDTDLISYDSGSTLRRARKESAVRYLRERKKRRARIGDTRAKTRRSMSSNKNDDDDDDDDDDDNERVRIRNREHKKRFSLDPSSRRRVHEDKSSEDSDSPRFKRLDKRKVRKTRHSSKAGPSTYYHGSCSRMERYRGDNVDDTESDDPPFERMDKVRARDSFTRKNGGSDATNSAHLRRNRMYGESSVNDNSIAPQNEESSGIASRTRGKKRSVVKQTVKFSEVSRESSDGFSSGSEEIFAENNIVTKNVIDLSSDENEKQEVPSIRDEINKTPEENEEHNTILADKETSGDGVQPSCDVERERVSEEQQQEKEHEKAVSVNRKAPSRKQQKGKKPRNEVSEKDTETNTIRAENAPRKRRVRKKTATCSDQSQLAKNSGEADGTNTLQSPNQSPSEMLTQTEPGSLALAVVNDIQGSKPSNEASEKDKETSIVCADDAPRKRRVRKKTATCSDQSQLAKNSGEADGTSTLQSPNQSPSEMLTQTEPGSLALAVVIDIQGTKPSNEASEKDKETSIVCADDAPRKRRVRKKTAPISDQSQLAKNSGEADGTNTLQSPNQSPSEMLTQTEPGSLALAVVNDIQGSKPSNEASEKHKETSIVHADNAPRKRRVRKKTATCSDQSQLAKNSGEADGTNTLQSPNQSPSEMLTQTEPGSLALAVVNNIQGTKQVTEETSIVCADDAPRKRPLKKKTAPISDQSQLANNSSEPEGTNTLQSPNQSPLKMLAQTEPGSLALVKFNDTQANVNKELVAREEKDCDNEETDKGIIVVENETEKQVEKKKLSSVLLPVELFHALADSMMGRGPLIEIEDESRQALTTTTTLPIKFRYGDEDEVPKPKEKTDSDIEIDCLFEEGFAMQSWSELPVVNTERECSVAEETQEARCNRGQHELRQDEVEGLYCIHCNRVELGPRDILPAWEPKPRRRRPGKKRIVNRDEVPESAVVAELITEPSVKNNASTSAAAVAVFKCPDEGTIWDVIPGLREGMFEHQQDGLEFLWKNVAGSIDLAELKNMAEQPNEVGGCMISHAPGTGKSRLTIVFLETYLKVFPESRPLIIAPAGMLIAWGLEFKKWNCPFRYHNLGNAEIHGNDKKYVPKQFLGSKKGIGKDVARMVKIFSWDREGSVLGISYTLFEKLAGRKQVRDETKKSKAKEEKYECLKQILLEKPGLVIMDEGHTARNETSNLFNAIVKLKTEKRVILSGTPFQNNLGELFNLLRLVRPAVANKIAEDKTLFEINRKSNEIDFEKLQNWKTLMLPYVNVHAGTNRRDLPSLRETVIHLRPEELQTRLIGTLVKNQGVTDESKVVSISVHPYLFKSCGKPEQHPDIDMNLVEASRLNPNEGTKTKFIIELLRLCNAANEKVLIFCQYISPLELIKDQLKEVFNWDEEKQILHIEGKLLQKKRQEFITIFNNPVSEARVMLASTKCCSEGISLIGASRVVLVDVVWNPSVERQAICRAYRIGQVKNVYIYHLITSGTPETDKHSKQVEKERLSEMVFCSSDRESDNAKNEESDCIQDKILDEMVVNPRLKNMFDKIIDRPKENFGSASPDLKHGDSVVAG